MQTATELDINAAENDFDGLEFREYMDNVESWSTPPITQDPEATIPIEQEFDFGASADFDALQYDRLNHGMFEVAIDPCLHGQHFVNEEPWSPMLAHAPYYQFEENTITPAKGPRRLTTASESSTPSDSHFTPASTPVSTPSTAVTNGRASLASSIGSVPSDAPSALLPSFQENSEGKMLLERLSSLPHGPARSGPRPGVYKYPCTIGACRKMFTRPDVLQRHVDSIHARGSMLYICLYRECGHAKMAREDKVVEHCIARGHPDQPGCVNFEELLADVACPPELLYYCLGCGFAQMDHSTSVEEHCSTHRHGGVECLALNKIMAARMEEYREDV